MPNTKSGGSHDDDRETGGPNLGDEVLQLLEQRMQGYLEQSYRKLMSHIEERFDETNDRLEALSIDRNRNHEDSRRPRVNMAHGDPVNRRVPSWRQEVQYEDISSDEEEEFEVEPVNNRDGWRRQGGGHHGGNGRRFNDQEGNDFKLKVDIASFNEGMRVEEFLDWIAEIDRFFAYTETHMGKQVILVACRLKGGVGLVG